MNVSKAAASEIVKEEHDRKLREAWTFRRDLDAEEVILTEMSEACLYAKFVLKGRWREMEELLSKLPVDEFGIQPDEILNYVLFIAERPVPEIEQHFLHDPESASLYQSMIDGGFRARHENSSDEGFTTVRLMRKKDPNTPSGGGSNNGSSPQSLDLVFSPGSSMSDRLARRINDEKNRQSLLEKAPKKLEWWEITGQRLRERDGQIAESSAKTSDLQSNEEVDEKRIDLGFGPSF